MSSSLSELTVRLERLFLLIIAISLPWELFQRTPIMGLTLTKISGGLFIAIVIARALLTRSLRLPRTGIEAPVALFALACVVSALHSVDAAASWRLTFTYGTYALFVYALAMHIKDVKTARTLLFVLIVSTAAVGILTLACALGVATPTRADTIGPETEQTSSKLLPNVRRMVAASDDFNQGAFPPMMAFVAVLFLAQNGRLTRRQRAGLFVILLLCFVQMLVAVSRTTLAASALVLVLLVLSRLRERQWSSRGILAGVACFAVVIVVAFPYVDVLLTRLTTIDNSQAVRMYGYTAALSVLPEFWLWGAGLDAIDVPLSYSEYGPRLAGVTLHNLPLKMFIELGVVGLGAFLWLWYRAISLMYKHLVVGNDQDDTHLGAALIAMAFASFWFILMQPIGALSFYPFILGVAMGPIQAMRNPGEHPTPDIRTRRTELALAIAVAAVVIIPNVLAYNRPVQRIDEFQPRAQAVALANLEMDIRMREGSTDID